MTGTQTAGRPGEAAGPGQAAHWMRGIADALRAAGLAVRLHSTAAGWDLTAAARRPGGRETEVVVDEDGYVEIRYWNRPGATPAHVADVVTRALGVVHSVPGERR